jgi:hypothetical protein
MASKKKGNGKILFMASSAKSFDPWRSAKQEMVQSLWAPAATAFKASAATSPSPGTNVVGIGVGEKVTDGLLTGVLAVKFFVRIKYPAGQVSAADRLPALVKGLPTDVEQVGTFRRFVVAQPAAPAAPAMPDPRVRLRPAQPGCSIGFEDPNHQFTMAGTFGALVAKGQKKFILSNNHVLADENKLPKGTPIFQPGLLDGGNPASDAIATLSDFQKLTAAGANKVDCAIAEVTNPKDASNEILFIGAPRGSAPAKLTTEVEKFGRTTGYRVGRVSSIDTDVQVQYDLGVLTFTNQIIIQGLNGQPFSAAGDSGSLIVERASKKAIGLLFAGSSSHTIANHIGDVLQALGISLV